MNKKSGKIIFWVAAVVSCILAGFLAGYFLGEILPADAGIAQKVVALFLLFLNVAGVYFVQMGLVKAGDMLWQKMNSIKKMKTGRVQFVWQLGINIVVIIAFFLTAVCTENRYPENGECNCNYNRCCCNSKKKSKPPESDIETSAVFYSAILSVENLCGADKYIFYYTKKAHLFS